jgi:hypothetical protein
VLSSFAMPTPNSGNWFRGPRSRRLTALTAAVLMTTGVSATAMLAQVATAPAATASSRTTLSEEPEVGRTDLTIVFNDGAGLTETWALYCDPADDLDPDPTETLHPDPVAACAALDANGETALPPVPVSRLCFEVYGGPQTATVTGIWKGQLVDAEFSRGDGCQIFRWNALEGLLPKG